MARFNGFTKKQLANVFTQMVTARELDLKMLILLKQGKFGYYLSYNDENFSLKDYEDNPETINLPQAILYIQEKNQEKASSKHIILNEHMSIREGKYGPYVFYKTENMKKPQFFSLKKCNFQEQTKKETLQWIQDTYFKKE